MRLWKRHNTVMWNNRDNCMRYYAIVAVFAQMRRRRRRQRTSTINPGEQIELFSYRDRIDHDHTRSLLKRELLNRGGPKRCAQLQIAIDLRYTH